MACATCEQLRERIKELELLMTPASHEALWALKRAYNLTANEASTILVMHQCKGRYAPPNLLHEARHIDRTTDGGLINDVRVMVHRIRKKMGHDVIETGLRDQGYKLTPKGLDMVRMALAAERASAIDDALTGAKPPTE